jgi:hypothetical protein
MDNRVRHDRPPGNLGDGTQIDLDLAIHQFSLALRNRGVIQGFHLCFSGGIGAMSGIKHLSQGIIEDLGRRLPGQRKTQREKLGLLVATMLDVRRAPT